MNKKFLFIISGLVVLVGGVILLFVVNDKEDEDNNDSVTSEQEDSDEDSSASTDTEDSQEEMADAEYMDISPDDAYDLIMDDEDLVVIDVSPVYEQGHLPGAVNYYVGDGSLDEAISSLDPEATYLVYCHSDSASISGAQKLIDAGFENVYRLEGNYGAWEDAGLPTEE